MKQKILCILLAICMSVALLASCAKLEIENEFPNVSDTMQSEVSENTALAGNGEDTLMKETINYTEDGRVNLEVYRHSNPEEPLPAIISLPGGAFGFLVGTDQEPTAMTFYERDFQAFVLNYSVGEYSGFPAPLDEVSWAIWQIRSHAEEWNVDPDKIVVMGFSAGVSVAGMFGNPVEYIRFI